MRFGFLGVWALLAFASTGCSSDGTGEVVEGALHAPVAVQRLDYVQACMREEGLEISPLNLAELREEITLATELDRGLEPTRLASHLRTDADGTHHYGVTETMNILEGEIRSAEVDEVQQRPYILESCVAEAAERHPRPSVALIDPSVRREAVERTLADPNTVSLIDEWRACMYAVGWPASSQDSIVVQLTTQSAWLLSEFGVEIEVETRADTMLPIDPIPGLEDIRTSGDLFDVEQRIARSDFACSDLGRMYEHIGEVIAREVERLELGMPSPWVPSSHR